MSILGCPFVEDAKGLKNYVDISRALPATVPGPAHEAFGEVVSILRDWHNGRSVAGDHKHWTVSVNVSRPWWITLRGHEGAIIALTGLLKKSARQDSIGQISVKCTCNR